MNQHSHMLEAFALADCAAAQLSAVEGHLAKGEFDTRRIRPTPHESAAAFKGLRAATKTVADRSGVDPETRERFVRCEGRYFRICWVNDPCHEAIEIEEIAVE